MAVLFAAREVGQPEDPKTGRPVLPLAIKSSKLLYSDDSRALVFVSALPPTEAAPSEVGVLFLIERLQKQWNISDYRRFYAFGKYAGINAEITGWGAGKEIMPIVTVNESEGGRGESDHISATYKIDGSRIKVMEME